MHSLVRRFAPSTPIPFVPSYDREIETVLDRSLSIRLERCIRRREIRHAAIMAKGRKSFPLYGQNGRMIVQHPDYKD